MKRYITIILIIISMLWIQCSKSSSTEPKEQPPDVSQILPEIEFPSTEGAPLEAQIWIIQFNVFSQIANLYWQQLYQTDARFENGKWTWSYNYNGITITFTAEKTDTAWVWSMTFNGTYTDPETGESFTYNNWKAFEGSTNLDGKSGSLKYYMENSTQLFLTFDWHIDASNVYYATLISYDETGAFYSKMELVLNQDGSGEIKGYEYVNNNWTLTITITWDNAGNWTVTSNG
ncbi:MAG: hypothetical protein D6748_00675 [Calditrichaeota bacterium]|nr:MAG: hypothetical protein D6748_00675 [Calditrichota bacterium]